MPVPSRQFPMVLASALVAAVAHVAARAEAVPHGLWELAGDHEAPFAVSWMVGGDDLFWVSDQKSGVAAMRRGSGEVAWGRRVPDGAPWRGVWLGDGAVVVVSDAVRTYQASDGVKRWEKGLGCAPAACTLRVLGVDRGHVLAVRAVADGGASAPDEPDERDEPAEVVLFDVATGSELWSRPLGGPARGPSPGAVFGPTWVAVERGGDRFGLRFFGREGGVPLGSWDAAVGARPADLLAVVAARGAVARFDLRPGAGRLAEVMLVTPGGESTKRLIDSMPLGGDTAQVAWASADANQAALFVPALGPRPAALVLAGWEGAQRVETLRGAGEPVRVGMRVLLPVAGAWRFFTASDVVPPSFAIPGLGSHARAFAVGERAVIIEGDALVTLGADSEVEGFGAPALGAVPVSAVAAVGSARADLLIARGERVAHAVLVPLAKAREGLSRAVIAGGDPGPLLGRLARFGAWLVPLQSAMPAMRDAPVLAADQQALNASFRKAWLAGDAEGVLDGASELIERLGEAPAERPKRVALMDGLALLMLDLVVAPGARPRTETAREAMVGLARAYAQSGDDVGRVPAAIWAAVAVLADDPLSAAEVLGRFARSPTAGTDPIVREAEAELVKRALFLVRTSAGPLKSETSRQMLVGALRYFRAFDAALGTDAEHARALFDGAEADPDIARELSDLLERAEGLAAARKGLGPALCGLVCEAAHAVCGGGEEGACAARCLQQGGARFVAGARPGGDARWFCDR